MKRQYNEMQQRQLRPLPPTLSPTLPVVATTTASVASAAAHSYPPPQFYFGWGPPHYPPPPQFYFGWGPPHYPPPPHFYFGWGSPHYGQQQGWWPPSHPAPPAPPPLMAYSSSAYAINNTSYSIKASAAATASIAPPPQRQKNMDFRFSKMPKSRQVHTWKRSKYVLDAPKITGGKMAMHIPVEIIIEILVKLPTRALLRFKSVCKSWHSIIQDRHFISRHLQNNSRRSSSGLNFISLSPSTEFNLCYFVKDVKDWHGFEIRGLEIQPEEIFYSISNSCDGLICVYTDSRIYVVNPSIRDVLELPKVPEQARYGSGFSVALVHDPTTGEYRVFRTFVRSLYARTSGCLIFTLGSCSWRFIEDAPLRISELTIPAVVNETIYWDISYKGYFSGPEIAVSLDIQSETFDTVMHPHCYSESSYYRVYEVGGYLCLLDKISQNFNQQTLWTLKDYSNNRWTKQIINLEMMENVTVGLACKFMPLALRDGKILTSSRSNRLDFYDPVTGCFDKPSYVAHERATTYIESLISPTEIQNKAMHPRFPESDNRVGSSLFQA